MIPLIWLLNNNQDLIEGYAIHISGIIRVGESKGFGNDLLTGESNLNRNRPSNVLLRLTLIADYIEQKFVELVGTSNSCREQSEKIMSESYTYENYATDRIELRRELKENNISNVEYEQSLYFNKKKYEQTSEAIKQAYVPYFKVVFEYMEKNLSSHDKHLSKFKENLLLTNGQQSEPD